MSVVDAFTSKLYFKVIIFVKRFLKWKVFIILRYPRNKTSKMFIVVASLYNCCATNLSWILDF